MDTLAFGQARRPVGVMTARRLELLMSGAIWGALVAWALIGWLM